MNEIDNVNRRKCFAVYILAEVWAGVPMPIEMVVEAERIRLSMQVEGTWLTA